MQESLIWLTDRFTRDSRRLRSWSTEKLSLFRFRSWSSLESPAPCNRHSLVGDLGTSFILGLTPIKPEQRLALPNAQPRPPTSHTVRGSVARSVLGRVSTSPRGSRPTPRAPPTNPDSPPAFQ